MQRRNIIKEYFNRYYQNDNKEGFGISRATKRASSVYGVLSFGHGAGDTPQKFEPFERKEGRAR